MMEIDYLALPIFGLHRTSVLRDSKDEPTGSLMLVDSRSPGGFVKVDGLGRLECAVADQIDLRPGFGGLERIGMQGEMR